MQKRNVRPNGPIHQDAEGGPDDGENKVDWPNPIGIGKRDVHGSVIRRRVGTTLTHSGILSPPAVQQDAHENMEREGCLMPDWENVLRP